MKKYWIVSLVILITLVSNSVKAQDASSSFFNKNGTVNLQTAMLDSLADTIAVVNHRWDDIVWRRTVYRVIDLRDKQNYQLYFPLVPNDTYRSLFRVMLDAVCKNKLPVYGKTERDILPDLSKPLADSLLTKAFVNCEKDTVNGTIVKDTLIKIDQFGNPSINPFPYAYYVKNQYKFIIQELVYFDKHTSRLYTKILAIAPMHPLTLENVMENSKATHEDADVWGYFQNSVLCWFLFDELRPYLAKQYVIPNGNEGERLTLDEFFAQRLYSSYLLGDTNMFNRMFIQFENNRDKIRREQKRVESELLNAEQDLWEY